MLGKSKTSLRDNVEGYLFILPWIIGFLTFTLGPMVASFYLSFTQWDLFTSPTFVGLSNYVRLFTADPKFWQSLKVTSLYSIFSIPLRLTVGLGLAILLNQKLYGRAMFRTIFYLPAVVSGVAVSLLWKWIFNSDFGVLNVILRALHLPTPDWLGDPKMVLPAYILMSAWGVGGIMVIFLAGLQDVPRHLYEAAEIDGAGTIAKFTRITLPMLSPVIFFNLVMGLIGAFQTFTEAYIIGGGNESLFYVLYLYQNAFRFFQMGYASALAWVLFLIIFALTLLVFRSSAAWVYYESEVKGGGKA